MLNLEKNIQKKSKYLSLVGGLDLLSPKSNFAIEKVNKKNHLSDTKII